MNKLILFDIDGTLLTSKSIDRWAQALKNVHGLEVESDKDFRGYTDYLILASLLESEGWEDDDIKKAMPSLLNELDKIHKEMFDIKNVYILPGVRELLEALSKKDVTLGLITGNLETIAERKLQGLGIWSYFSVGGYGSDPHVARSDLVKLAVERAGYQDKLKDVYVIGDTVLDIEAAHKAGVVNSVGVINGLRDPKELKDAGASIVFDDLKDTNNVISKLGL